MIATFLCVAPLLLSIASGIRFPVSEKSTWQQVTDEELPRSRHVNMRVALKPRNEALLTDKVHSIASPSSREFRKYMKNRELTELVGVSEGDLRRVSDWLESAGMNIIEVAANRDWVTVSGSPSSIEKAFDTELSYWSNKITGEKKIGSVSSYSIPDELSNVVQFIPGLTSFSFGVWRPIAHKATADELSVAKSVTPATVQEIYKTDISGTSGSRLGSQTVIQFGKLANFNEDDLQMFFDEYATELKGEECGTVYGTNNGDIRGSIESNLDVQYIMSTGAHVNTSTFKMTEDMDNIEDAMLDYAYIVNNMTEPPLVHSISYGEYGGEYDNSTVQRFNYELQKMAAKGITVMLASGDNGVGCDRQGTTQEFDFPSSPYITMVGATYLDSKSGGEVGATLSSGGFSKDYYRPSWQADQVEAYFATDSYKDHIPSEAFYADGRAYPDVAAFGQNVEVISEMASTGVSGTSCSSPIFAGIVSLINAELMAEGEAPLGWINPWIYANPQMFTDITTGSNPYQKCDGFYAAPGWDPVTGMGTPIYTEMLKAAKLSSSNK